MLWICFFDKKHQNHPEKRDAARIELTSPKLGILTYTNMCRCFLCVAVFLFAQLGDGFADKRGGRAGKKSLKTELLQPIVGCTWKFSKKQQVMKDNFMIQNYCDLGIFVTP